MADEQLAVEAVRLTWLRTYAPNLTSLPVSSVWKSFESTPRTVLTDVPYVSLQVEEVNAFEASGARGFPISGDQANSSTAERRT